MRLFGRPLRSLRYRAILGFLLLAAPAGLSATATAETVSPDAAANVRDGAQPIASQARTSALDGIATVVQQALRDKKLPGCVVAIGGRNGIVYQRAFGARAVLPEPEAMTEDTIFDLASLTKPIATATAIAILADQGKVDLDEKVARYLPAMRMLGKGEMTVRQLLLHISGLPSETALSDYEHGRAHALRRIAATPLRAEPGQRLIYSDVGYLVLEEVVRNVTHDRLDVFVKHAIFEPLGMSDTGFLPDAAKRARIAPTEMRNGAWMRGNVHDPRAFRLGGVAGHAGLFGTVADLARYAQMILSGGMLGGKRVLSPAAVQRMLAPHDVPDGIRALGWDMQTAYSSNRGTLLSRRAIGHGGYTGTSLWIDPEQDLFVVFLSNRVHPDGKGSVNALAGAIATLAAGALGIPTAAADANEGGLSTGIDQLIAQKFAPLRGLRFALLTNDSARTRGGLRTTDVLAAERGLHMVGLLCPEHGLSAARDEHIPDGTDGKTGLPIFSLYGGALGPRSHGIKGPRSVTLPPDIDAVVVDLPDAGARFFTYASTLHATLRTAASRNLDVFVLDRPNPIDALDVSGPVLQPSERSPVNHLDLPVRHGMTMGELAEMINAEEHLGLRLDIVRMGGYRRDAYHDETGLSWWPPSPNLRTVEQAVLYPGVALLEATNVSVGRGTDSPFEVVGAPWIDDSHALVETLAAAGLAGIRFDAASFVPKATRFAGQLCRGLRLRVTDRKAFEPIRTGLAIALALRKHFTQAWDGSRMRGMLGDPAVAQAILAGKPLAEVEAVFRPDLEAFGKKRAKYLLYP